MAKSTKKRFLRAAAVVLAVVLLLVGGCLIYMNDYYRADDDAVAALLAAGRTQPDVRGNLTIFAPDNPAAGLIFYPGAKVEHEAYLPLMQAMADRGLLCVLVEMPLRFALLDSSAAGDVPALFPEVTEWYLSGHSLGGTAAGMYLGGHADDFAGLVLLGSYITEDLSDAPLRALSVYGSEDFVVGLDTFAQYRDMLPENAGEYVIDGGCHAGFGLYGPQDDDGTPTLTPAEQIALTAQQVADFCLQAQE